MDQQRRVANRGLCLLNIVPHPMPRDLKRKHKHGHAYNERKEPTELETKPKLASGSQLALPFLLRLSGLHLKVQGNKFHVAKAVRVVQMLALYAQQAPHPATEDFLAE
jgi:hypothetical protein